MYGSFYGKTLEEAAAKRQAERDKMTVRNNPPRQVGLIILGAGFIRNQREAGRGLHHFFQCDRGQRGDGGGLVPN